MVFYKNIKMYFIVCFHWNSMFCFLWLFKLSFINVLDFIIVCLLHNKLKYVIFICILTTVLYEGEKMFKTSMGECDYSN